MTALTKYHNPETGNVNRVLLFSATDAEFFDLVRDACRVRYWQQGDPVPVFATPEGMTPLSVVGRDGALAVFLIDERVKFGPGVDAGTLLQVDPRLWSPSFRAQTHCTNIGMPKPSQQALCWPNG